MKKSFVLVTGLAMAFSLAACDPTPLHSSVRSLPTTSFDVKSDTSTDTGTSSESAPTVKPYVVIGWYSKSETSGLTADIVANFEAAYKAHLTDAGVSSSLIATVAFQAIDGKVAEVVDAIQSQYGTDNAVSLFLGGGGNLLTTAGSNGQTLADTLGSVTATDSNDVVMGDYDGTYKTRHVTLLADATANTVAKDAYDFALSEAGRAALVLNAPTSSSSSTTTVDPENPYVVIGWWNYSKSGLTNDIMANFEAGYKAYLATQNVSTSNIDSIVIRPYIESKMANLGAALGNDADVDVFLGAGKALVVDGKVTGTEITAVNQTTGLTMGGISSRCIFQLSEDEAAAACYTWAISDDGIATLQTPSTTA